MKDTLESRLKEEKIEACFRFMRNFVPVAGQIWLNERKRIQDMEKEARDDYLSFLDGLLRDVFYYGLFQANPLAAVSTEPISHQKIIEEDVPIVCDEYSELTNLFSPSDRTICTATLTPLDGVDQYIGNGDDFSIGCGILAADGIGFSHSAVYFPSRNLIYFTHNICLKTSMVESRPKYSKIRVYHVYEAEKEYQSAKRRVQSLRETLAREESEVDLTDPHPMDCVYDVASRLKKEEEKETRLKVFRDGTRTNSIHYIYEEIGRFNLVETDQVDQLSGLSANRKYLLESMMLRSVTG
jgi:hypothetical protein